MLNPSSHHHPSIYSDTTHHFYQTTLSLIDAFMEMLDRWTYERRFHSYRVTTLSLLIGESMGLTSRDLFVLGVGSLLHDVGKMRIPHDILVKPGKLTDKEWSIMRHHPQMGGEILDRFPPLRFARDIVVQHQERWDGSGYPSGIMGKEIVLGARIFALADSYDAMISQRSYNHALSHYETVAELSGQAGIYYDPEVIDHFLSVVSTDVFKYQPWEEHDGFLEEIFPSERFVQLFSGK